MREHLCWRRLRIRAKQGSHIDILQRVKFRIFFVESALSETLEKVQYKTESDKHRLRRVDICLASGQNKLVKISSRLLFNVTGIEFIDKTPHSTKSESNTVKSPLNFAF